VAFEKDVDRVRRVLDHFDWDLQLYDGEVWARCSSYDVIVAYMPSGIVVRGMCPLLRSKWTDPAVVVLDKAMRYAIPILGGHHGANEVAESLGVLGIDAILTTAMEFEDGLSVGIGCNRGTSSREILDAMDLALAEVGATMDEVRVVATADLKRDEAGLIEAIDAIKRPIMFATKEELDHVDVPSDSEASRIGYRSVAEGSSLLYSNKREMVLTKRRYGGVTIAIAR
jgi:cobalt-precorrin 5A hydrolase